MIRSNALRIPALLLGSSVLLFAACGGGTADYRAANARRDGYRPEATAKAKALLAKIDRLGISCLQIGEYPYALIVKGYSAGNEPMALGAANCSAPVAANENPGANSEDVLAEVYGKDPNALVFVRQKAKFICKRAERLAKGTRDSALGFHGIPFVMATDRTWIIEPDSFAMARRIGKLLGQPAQDMCRFD